MDPRPFCVIHLHSETPKPTNVGRVIHPDFLWHVFVVTPSVFDSSARQVDGYELGAAFREIAQVMAQPLEPYQRILLDAVRRGIADGSDRDDTGDR